MAQGDPRTDDQLLEIVEAFALRARRVLAHSLWANEFDLRFLADGAWIARRKDGAVSLERRLPNEEVLESLAARVRPLTLKNDRIHHGDVLKALSAYLTRHGHPDEARGVGRCGKTGSRWTSRWGVWLRHFAEEDRLG